MPRIKFEEYAQNVEACRQSMIGMLNSNNIYIDKNASLADINRITQSYISSLDIQKNPNKLIEIPEGYCEVRFVDIDGTLLKTEIIKKGGGVIPPENPNYDPERLTFVRWASAIGEKFDNITTDIDYAPLYNIKEPNTSYFFVNMQDYTTDTVVFDYIYVSGGYYKNGNSSTSISLKDNYQCEIDWGDDTKSYLIDDTIGTANSKTFKITHTYENYGKYIIKIKYYALTELAQNALDNTGNTSSQAYMNFNGDLLSTVPNDSNHEESLKNYACLEHCYIHRLHGYSSYASYYGYYSNLNVIVVVNHVGSNWLPGVVPIITGPHWVNSGNNNYWPLNNYTKYLIIDSSAYWKTDTSNLSGYNIVRLQAIKSTHKLTKFIVNGDTLYPYSRDGLTNSSYIKVPLNMCYLQKIVLIGNVPIDLGYEYDNRNNLYVVDILMSDAQEYWSIEGNPSSGNYYRVPYMSKNICRQTVKSALYGTYPPHVPIAYLSNKFEWRFCQYAYIGDFIMDSDYSFNISMPNYTQIKSPNKLIYLLNNLKDLASSGLANKKITLNYILKPYFNMYVKLDSTAYIKAKKDDTTAITLMEAINQKGWTVTFTHANY